MAERETIDRGICSLSADFCPWPLTIRAWRCQRAAAEMAIGLTLPG